MRTLDGAVAVVTGAGSGIGRALAIALAERGCDLALCDRDATALEATRELLSAAHRATIARVDVADLAEMTAFRDAVMAEFGRVSLLINNAGVSLYGSFDEVSIEDLHWILGINFWGSVYATKLFLPSLAREPEANIVTMSSLFGLIAPPLQVGYCASKFAIRGFAEALRHELGATSVRTTVVHPGGVDTNIARSARCGATADATRYARDLAGFQRSLVMPPSVAARTIVGAVLRDAPRLVLGNDARIVELVARFFPARYFAILRPLFDPKGRFARTETT
ncbi:MAG: SDR family NAD(P)-dependent oxidoreductase [Vulcanimicrobiaceae bacterium]